MAGGGEEIDAKTLRVLQSDQGQAGGPLSHPLPEVKIINPNLDNNTIPHQDDLGSLSWSPQLIPTALYWNIDNMIPQGTVSLKAQKDTWGGGVVRG